MHHTSDPFSLDGKVALWRGGSIPMQKHHAARPHSHSTITQKAIAGITLDATD